MTWFAAHLRPELASLSAYVPHVPEGIEIRLDANEGLPLPGEILRHALAHVRTHVLVSAYPDAQARELRAALSPHTGAPEDHIIVGAGSDELIALLCSCLSRGRDGSPARVLMPSPTFVMYGVTARAHGLSPHEVPLDDAFDLDASAMCEAIARLCPSIIYIASPNNPTGTTMSSERLERILGAAWEVGALVVLDEAYVDYSDKGSLRRWRAAHPNLAILRTLSKVGMAALRIGWLEADPELVRELDKGRQPFNTSAVSQSIATYVLGHHADMIRDHADQVRARRKEVAGEVRRRLPNVAVTDSDANFLLLTLPVDGETVAARLAKRGILVRAFPRGGPRLHHCIRVTVGGHGAMDRFVESLSLCLASDM